MPGRFWKEKIGLYPPNFVVHSEIPEKIQECLGGSSLRGEAQLLALLYSFAEGITDFNSEYNAYCLQSA